MFRRYEYIKPKLVPGYCAVGLYVRKASSINRLTTAFECVPFLARVPISLPIMPCSVAHLPPKGAYSMPNCSRCLSRRYSVKVRTFQSSMSRACQSVAGGSFLIIRYRLHNNRDIPRLLFAVTSYPLFLHVIAQSPQAISEYLAERKR